MDYSEIQCFTVLHGWGGGCESFRYAKFRRSDLPPSGVGISKYKLLQEIATPVTLIKVWLPPAIIDIGDSLRGAPRSLVRNDN